MMKRPTRPKNLLPAQPKCILLNMPECGSGGPSFLTPEKSSVAIGGTLAWIAGGEGVLKGRGGGGGSRYSLPPSLGQPNRRVKGK